MILMVIFKKLIQIIRKSDESSAKYFNSIFFEAF